MEYRLHPSKYIARTEHKRKFRWNKPGDYERALRELNQIAAQEYWALTKKHGRRISGEGQIRVVMPSRIYMTYAYAFYDQGTASHG